MTGFDLKFNTGLNSFLSAYRVFVSSMENTMHDFRNFFWVAWCWNFWMKLSISLFYVFHHFVCNLQKIIPVVVVVVVVYYARTWDYFFLLSGSWVNFILLSRAFVSNKAKGWFSKQVVQEKKACQILRKTNISYPLDMHTIWTRVVVKTIQDLLV